MEAEKRLAQFVALDGSSVGPPLSLPCDITPEGLETILNTLITENKAGENEHKAYNFWVEDIPILNSLGSDLEDANNLKKKTKNRHDDLETQLNIKFVPQAVWRVKPVSRCGSTLSGHTEAILTVSFSHNGKILASGSGDCTVRFWDSLTNTPIRQEDKKAGHSNWVLVISWSPKEEILASGGMDNKILLWSVSENEKSSVKVSKIIGSPFLGHTKWITALCWEPLHLLSGNTIRPLRLASSSKDGTVRIWDITRQSCVTVLSGHTDSVSSIRWSGENTIISGSRDRTIRVWDPETGKLLHILKGHGHWVNSLALNTDYAIRTGSFDPELDMKNNLPKTDDEKVKVAKKKYDQIIQESGCERLVSASDDFTLILWKISPSSSNSEGPELISRLTGHQALVNHVLFSPNGRCISSSSFDRSVKIWSGISGTYLGSLRGHVGPVYQSAWSSDSRLLLTGSKDSTLKIWSVDPSSSVRKNGDRKSLFCLKNECPGHEDEVYAVDWSVDGTNAASGGKDKNLKLWKQ